MFASLAFAIATLATAADLIHDPAVMSFSRVLARKAISDRSQEHGAFVVRSEEGILYFVAWPPSGEKDQLRWHGSFPEGTVAILHTHPDWLPAASQLDVRTARRSRIPVYVITPSTISKTVGGESAVVIGDHWLDKK